MTIKNWLQNSTDVLKTSHIESAQLDSEILLADLLERDRSWILAHPEHEINRAQLSALEEKIKRRTNHEPMAYIRGKQEFYGRDFIANQDTLTPRPETETLIELALEILKNHTIVSVADIGTGSGCIIISLQLESESKAVFTGYDISEEALIVAKQNATVLQSSALFEKADIKELAEQKWQSAELIVANLPYVPDEYVINKAATHEPKIALFSGADGLDLYRVLFSRLSSVNMIVLTESLAMQHKDLEEIARMRGYKLIKSNDLIQVFSRTK